MFDDIFVPLDKLFKAPVNRVVLTMDNEQVSPEYDDGVTPFHVMENYINKIREAQAAGFSKDREVFLVTKNINLEMENQKLHEVINVLLTGKEYHEEMNTHCWVADELLKLKRGKF